MSITAKEKGLKGIFLRVENDTRGAVVEGTDIFPVRTLYELVETFSRLHRMEPFRVEGKTLFRREGEDVDFGDLRGQENVKRAVEIAAAGGHNMLMMKIV